MMGLVVHVEIGNLFGPLSWIIWASLGGELEEREVIDYKTSLTIFKNRTG